MFKQLSVELYDESFFLKQKAININRSIAMADAPATRERSHENKGVTVNLKVLSLIEDRWMLSSKL